MTAIVDLSRERIRRLAIANGCRPIWSEYYGVWCCTCEGGTHYGDQQSSIMSLKSAGRQRP